MVDIWFRWVVACRLRLGTLGSARATERDGACWPSSVAELAARLPVTDLLLMYVGHGGQSGRFVRRISFVSWEERCGTGPVCAAECVVSPPFERANGSGLHSGQ